MKTTLLFTVILYFGVCILQPHVSHATFGKNRNPSSLKEEDKPARLARSNSSRNNDAVKIYPDLIRKAMHVVAKENNGKQIDFFVFDMEGTLMKHYKMKNGDHKKLNGLARGKYLYHVFCGDEETASGKFDIR